MKSFKKLMSDKNKLPVISGVMIVNLDGRLDLYEGRKWISGRFKIGLDQPNHGVGLKHAHVYGRNGQELVVVNIDGTASHGTRGRLHDDDAAALRARGYNIRSDNLVEWWLCPVKLELLFE